MPCLDDMEQVVLLCALKGELMGIRKTDPMARSSGTLASAPTPTEHQIPTTTVPNGWGNISALVSHIGKNETQLQRSLLHSHIINTAMSKRVLVPRQITAPCKEWHLDGSQQTLWLAHPSTMQLEPPALCPYGPVRRLPRGEWDLPYVSFVSDMPIESAATPLSPLGHWVRLFICNHADVKKVMGKLPKKKHTFTECGYKIHNGICSVIKLNSTGLGLPCIPLKLHIHLWFIANCVPFKTPNTFAQKF